METMINAHTTSWTSWIILACTQRSAQVRRGHARPETSPRLLVTTGPLRSARPLERTAQLKHCPAPKRQPPLVILRHPIPLHVGGSKRHQSSNQGKKCASHPVEAAASGKNAKGRPEKGLDEEVPRNPDVMSAEPDERAIDLSASRTGNLSEGQLLTCPRGKQASQEFFEGP